MTAPARATARGFTLVELLVALVIFTVGILGLAATTSFVVLQTTMAELSTERSAAVQEIVEQLKATDYDQVASGTAYVGPYSMSWTVSAGNRSKVIALASTGPGVTSGSGMPSLATSVTENTSYRILQP